jgi:uncharacterized protein (DUF736 family)
MVARQRNEKEIQVLATIGQFKKEGEIFNGGIRTLTISASRVRIIPVDKLSDTAPDFRVYANGAEIGAAWKRESEEGNEYLSLKIDDPSLAKPFYARLVGNGEPGEHALIWTR